VLILPAFSNARRQDPRQHQCVMNLKLVGFVYIVWAGDHNGKFPMQMSVTNGGTMESTADGKNPWLNLLVMSNELITPKLLVCPSDKSRIAAKDFSTGLSAKNVSYFVGLDADTNHPNMFLSGDDNFAIGGVPVKSGLLEFSTNAAIAWTEERHLFAGNIVFADGHIEQTSLQCLQKAAQNTSVATNRLAIP
jgi:prepilin-type processing-associated H-X9-DG protein